jgi:outer membrane protein TolC
LAWSSDHAERSALARANDLDAQALERRVDIEIRSALVALRNAQAALAQAAVGLDAARKNASETSEMYRQGLTGALQVADATVSLYEAEVALSGERYGLASAYLGLRAAVGLSPLRTEIEK